jgi:hypothetical protein
MRNLFLVSCFFLCVRLATAQTSIEQVKLDRVHPGLTSSETRHLFPELDERFAKGVKDARSVVIDSITFLHLRGHGFFSFRHDTLVTFLWTKADTVSDSKLLAHRLEEYTTLRKQVERSLKSVPPNQSPRNTELYRYESWSLPDGLVELLFDRGKITVGMNQMPPQLRKHNQ